MSRSSKTLREIAYAMKKMRKVENSTNIYRIFQRLIVSTLKDSTHPLNIISTNILIFWIPFFRRKTTEQIMLHPLKARSFSDLLTVLGDCTINK